MKACILTGLVLVSLVGLGVTSAQAAQYVVHYNCPHWKVKEFDEYGNDGSRLVGEAAVRTKQKLEKSGFETRISFSHSEVLLSKDARFLTDYHQVVKFRTKNARKHSFSSLSDAIALRDFLQRLGVAATITTQ